MLVYRLTSSQYANDLSGYGASIKGARWNSAGQFMLYTAENRSLAMAEVLVHFSASTMPDDFQMVTIEIPDDMEYIEIEVEQLPSNWSVFPTTDSTQKIGDRFIREKNTCVLKVPSVVTNGEFNYLFNPQHDDFRKIKVVKVEPFKLDRRLVE
jgi:RES domain-containing protein